VVGLKWKNKILRPLVLFWESVYIYVKKYAFIILFMDTSRAEWMSNMETI